MITGIVEAVSTKDVNTKFGLKPTFSIKVNGNWVKCGFKNPNASVGDEVEFDGNTGTYGMETKAVAVLRKGAGVGAVPSSAPVATSAPAPMKPAYVAKVFPIPALHGDRSIIRQNALARATDIVIAAAGGKAFGVDYDETSKQIIKLARKFEAYTAGDLDMAEAEAEAAAEATAGPAF
jgi:predicted ferric reductase